MRKIWNMIVNENIKVFAKASTIVMLAIIVVLVVAYSLLSWATSQGAKGLVGESATLDYNKLIQAEEQEKSIGWEIRVDQYTFMRDNNISQYNDWRALAVEEAYALKAKLPHTQENTAGTADDSLAESTYTDFDAIMDTVKKDDWKTYLRDKEARIQEDPSIPQAAKEAQVWSIQFRINHDLKPEARNAINGDWKNELVYTLEDTKHSINEIMQQQYAERDVERLSKLNDIVLIDTYRLENDINIHTKANNLWNINLTTDEDVMIFLSQGWNFWEFFEGSTDLITVVSILIIIIAGSMVSSEFSSGTIKFLLINPVSRWKILVSKYASLFSISFVMLVILYISSAIFSGVFFGFEGIDAPYLYISGEQVQSGSSFLFVAWKYILGSVELIVIATLAFTLSSLTRNSAMSIGLGVSLLLVGGGITNMLASNQMDWARYVLFSNTNLNNILMKMTPFLGHTITFALTVLAVYMIVFCLTAWDSFVRRDVR